MLIGIRIRRDLSYLFHLFNFLLFTFFLFFIFVSFQYSLFCFFYDCCMEQNRQFKIGILTMIVYVRRSYLRCFRNPGSIYLICNYDLISNYRILSTPYFNLHSMIYWVGLIWLITFGFCSISLHSFLVILIFLFKFTSIWI